MNVQEGAFTLHGYFRSSAAYRVRIALNIKDISYQAVAYHLRKGEQRSDGYLRLNPQGLVPALEVDKLVLTQSLAIIEFLDEQYPTPALLPTEPAARARVRALAQIIACDIHPVDNLRVLHYLRNVLEQPEDAVRSWYAHWIREGFEAFESLLLDNRPTGQFCHGNMPTLADICLVPQVANARNFDVDLSAYPTLLRIADAAAALSAFQKASPSNQLDAE